ncbi:winged helix-turn-helix transcriptional regulator [Marinifilum flexuosum]|uniref:winged helix-turn-helix transcriptional regulator n=1 Tax=Marinifilum flexuosum TaxID=1117708 RepID=UPI002494529E|nr:helix-turn-helix domain-containing protein [Marinifilum flexuosum]
MKNKIELSPQCTSQLRAIGDTMELLSGKWKIQIVGTLLLNGAMRFMELKRALNGIAPKKLSNDLQELETNDILTRTVKETKPITVEYELTAHGRTLENLINEAMDWGFKHRQKMIE